MPVSISDRSRVPAWTNPFAIVYICASNSMVTAGGQLMLGCELDEFRDVQFGGDA